MLKVEKFNVRIVDVGERYGRKDRLVNEEAPFVEFYDSRYPHHPGRDQFISRYAITTILNGTYPDGLCLHGDAPEWTVSADGMRQVVEYLREWQALQ